MATMSFGEALKDVNTKGAVESGLYDVEVTKAESGVTKAGDKIKWNLTTKVLLGEHANEVITFMLAMPTGNDSDGARFYFAKKMEGLGFDVSELRNENPDPAVVAKRMVGVRARLELNNDAGSRFNNVDSITFLGRNAPNAPASAAAPAPAGAPAWEASDEEDPF